ncbi:MAG: hypothetical protein PHW56_06975 [Methanosarcinaceae archaeon]|nr:hypothetical protein [Methanosarcinaceae archaeon]
MVNAEQAKQAKMKQVAKQAPKGPETEDVAPEKMSIIKERTPEEKAKAHKEGIIKTIVSGILGILAGFISFNQYGAGEDRIWYALLTITIVITYYAQKLIYPGLKISTKEFKFKDWFYVEFIVVDFFLVTWTLLLN